MAEIFPETPITSLPAAVAAMGALPVPVGPQPLALSEEQLDALAAAGNRVVNDEVHQHLCMCDAWPEKCVSTGHYLMGAWDVDGLEAALPAVLGLWEQMRGGELAALRAQVADLLAERHTTNEALPDVAEALRADRGVEESSAGGFPPALPWLALMDEDDRVEFLDELAESATVNQSSDVRLAEIERTCATWRLIAETQHGHNTAPGPDAVTQSFTPMPVLREVLDGEHYAHVHHGYLKGHDLPELGGAS